MARTVLIEGWRGIGHSYSLVNQNQIVALLDRPEIALYHNDLPFYGRAWNRRDTPSGFDPAVQARIDAVPPPGDRRADTIYRIGFPPRAYGGDAEKIFCFNTLEYFQKPAFYDGPETAQTYANNAVRIVTPSNWSRAAFLASGFKPEDVVVVPHGIDPATYRPLPSGERAAIRKRLGFADDSFVFLNVSAMTTNKGIGELLEAFATVQARFGRVRLVLKDMAALYQTKASESLERFRRKRPDLATGRVMKALTILSQNVPQKMLRELYGACDAYVSPYRAEGFNLPPLEAAACGTPIVVTAGGATDDYFDPAIGLQIASRPAIDARFGRCRKPELDSLIDCMTRLIEDRAPQIDRAGGAALVHARHSWARVADRLVALF